MFLYRRFTVRQRMSKGLNEKGNFEQTAFKTMKNILAISGSLRAESANLKIIEYVFKLAADSLKISVFQNLSQLPAFNPDLDAEGTSPSAEVEDFRRQIKEADSVLICTPEYVFAVPGRTEKRD